MTCWIISAMSCGWTKPRSNRVSGVGIGKRALPMAEPTALLLPPAALCDDRARSEKASN